MFIYKGYMARPADKGWNITKAGVFQGWVAGSDQKYAKQHIDELIRNLAG